MIRVLVVDDQRLVARLLPDVVLMDLRRPGVDGITATARLTARPHVAVTTVKTHVTSLMTKTGADNRVRLALYAVSE